MLSGSASCSGSAPCHDSAIDSTVEAENLAIDPKLLGQLRKKPKLSGTQKESPAVEERCKNGTICLSSDRRDLQ